MDDPAPPSRPTPRTRALAGFAFVALAGFAFVALAASVAHARRAPVPRLATPVWRASAAQTFVAADGERGVVELAWQAVPGASHYRVELWRHAAGGPPLLLQLVDGAVLRLAAPAVPVGSYVATVGAVDGAGVASLPSAPLAIDVVLLRVVPAGIDPASGTASDAELAQAPLGARLVAPRGLKCDAGAGAPGSMIVLSASGPATLRCRDARGLVTPAVGFEVVRPPVTMALELPGGGASVRRGQAFVVRVVAPPALLPLLSVKVSEGAIAAPLGAGARGAIASVRVADDDADGGTLARPGDEVVVELVMIVDDVIVVIESASAAIAAPPLPPLAVEHVPRFDRVWELGGFGTLAHLGGGARVACRLAPYFAVEGELAQVGSTFEAGAHARVEGRLGVARPFVLVGAARAHLDDGADPARALTNDMIVYAGVGGLVDVIVRAGLRVDFRFRMGPLDPAGDEWGPGVELTVGGWFSL